MNGYGGSLSSLSVGDLYKDVAFNEGAQTAVQAQSGNDFQPSESPRAVAHAMVVVILILAGIRILYDLAE